MESNVMDSYRKQVSLAAVIAPNESLCQTNSKGLKVLSQTAGLKFFCRMNMFTVQQSKRN